MADRLMGQDGHRNPPLMMTIPQSPLEAKRLAIQG
jgi:hypothetical protein